MWRLVAIGFAWTAGLAALVVAAWFAVELGLFAALVMGLAVGLALRYGWGRIRKVTREDPTQKLAGGRGGTSPPSRMPASPEEPMRADESMPVGRSVPAPARSRTRFLAWAALGVGAVGFAAAVALVIGMGMATPPDATPPDPPPPGIASIYRASVEPGPERSSLVIRERYAVAVADVEKSPDLQSPEAFRPAEGDFYVPDGWEAFVVRDSVVLTRQRTETIDVSLLRRTSVVTLDVPQVSYDGPVLWARPGSTIELDLPRHFLALTFPPAQSTADLLDPRGLERTVIPVTVAAGDSRAVRLQVLHPLLRHRVGENLTQASLLAPVKWAGLALMAIFADQIRGRLLLPLARRIAKGLRLPLFEGQA